MRSSVRLLEAGRTKNRGGGTSGCVATRYCWWQGIWVKKDDNVLMRKSEMLMGARSEEKQPVEC